MVVDLSFGLLALVTAIFLAHRFQRIITNPIGRLADVARTVAKHKDYSLRAEKYSDDEIGELTDVFNSMLLQVQDRDNALEKSHSMLEQRVEERTRELQIAKEVAEQAARKEIAKMQAERLQRAEKRLDRALEPLQDDLPYPPRPPHKP